MAEGIFRNVEKLKGTSKNKGEEGLVLSPVPLRSFRAPKRARGTQGAWGSPRDTVTYSTKGSDRLVGTSKYLDEPHTRDKPTFSFQKPEGIDIGMEQGEDWALSDEDLMFPCLDWEPPNRNKKKEKVTCTVMEEEEQVCNELFAIFQTRQGAAAPEPKEKQQQQSSYDNRVSPQFFKRMESDEDLANAILSLSSPPPRASNPITQNKCFGKGMCVLPAWEEEDFREDEEDPLNRRSERVFRSCSAPTVSL